MKRSTDPNDSIRKELLECQPIDTCASARDAVQKILDVTSSNTIKLPANILIRFYFDPNVPSGIVNVNVPPKDEPTRRKMKENKDANGPLPETRCYTILALPANDPKSVPADHWDNPVTAFQSHLVCCYEPWLEKSGLVCK
jgi:hypothetical protein